MGQAGCRGCTTRTTRSSRCSTASGSRHASLIGRAALPGRATRSVDDRLIKLYRHGLIARHNTGLRERTRADGKAPVLYSLTCRGLQVAKERKPAPAISPKREWRAIEQPRAGRLAHDLHALGWAIEFHRAVGELATDRWRTPRYATGRYPVPQIGSGQRRHPITLNEIKVPEGQAIIDVELKTFTEIKPDLSLELRIESLKLTFDLLVELDLTARPSYNREKFLAYDAFLCGWCLAHPRYQAQRTRPAVVFVCRDAHDALGCAREADETMTGRIGAMGTPPEHWYYAGRDHLFFAVEGDIHHRDLSALALPPTPLDYASDSRQPGATSRPGHPAQEADSELVTHLRACPSPDIQLVRKVSRASANPSSRGSPESHRRWPPDLQDVVKAATMGAHPRVTRRDRDSSACCGPELSGARRLSWRQPPQVASHGSQFGDRSTQRAQLGTNPGAAGRGTAQRRVGPERSLGAHGLR